MSNAQIKRSNDLVGCFLNRVAPFSKFFFARW